MRGSQGRSPKLTSPLALSAILLSILLSIRLIPVSQVYNYIIIIYIISIRLIPVSQVTYNWGV